MTSTTCTFLITAGGGGCGDLILAPRFGLTVSFSAVTGGRDGGRQETGFVDPGRRHHRIIHEVPQNQNDLPIEDSQCKLFGVFRRHGERDGVHGDRLVVSPFDGQTCGEDPDVLENKLGNLLRPAARLSSTRHPPGRPG